MVMKLYLIKSSISPYDLISLLFIALLINNSVFCAMSKHQKYMFGEQQSVNDYSNNEVDMIKVLANQNKKDKSLRLPSTNKIIFFYKRKDIQYDPENPLNTVD